jgi:hypothetical protein
MIKVWNDFWGWFGDIGWVFFLIGMFFGGIALMLSTDYDERVHRKRIAAGCYAQGKVVVETDAGPACTDPHLLVLVK